MTSSLWVALDGIRRAWFNN